MKKLAILTCLLAAQLGGAAVTQAQDKASSPIELPEGCRSSGQSSAANQVSQQMDAAAGELTETQKGLHNAMRAMNDPMMQGAMNEDADLAWICAMIPHHQGAIAMARAGLAGADNEESKRLAQKTIEENEAGVKELIDWVGEHAAAEREK